MQTLPSNWKAEPIQRRVKKVRVFPKTGTRGEFGERKRGQPLADYARVKHPDHKLGIHDFKMEITGQYNRVFPRIVKEGVKIEKLLHQQKSDPAKVNI